MSLISACKQKGMTLLEVMLALAILATSGLAVMNAASQALSNQAYLEQKTYALWVASNRLVDLKLEGQWPGASWQYDSEELAGTTWYLRYQTVQAGENNFKALDIEVSDKKEGSPLAYIRTYIAK